MSRTINRVEILGRVGADPEMRHSQNGTAVTTLRLATDRRRQSGDTEADWHSVVCWGKQAEAVAQYVRKGNRLYVAGSLAQNTFERDDGQRVHRTEVHAQEVVFLDSNGNGNGQRPEREQAEGGSLPHRRRLPDPRPSSHRNPRTRRPIPAAAHGAASSGRRPRVRFRPTNTARRTST